MCPRTMLLVTVLIALFGCTSPRPGGDRSAAGSPQTGATKKVVASVRGDVRTLSEAINSGAGSSIAGTREIDLLVSAGLGLLDSAGQHRPQLAESVPTIENGQWKVFPDGRMETSFRLRHDAVWHDGTPFTAED